MASGIIPFDLKREQTAQLIPDRPLATNSEISYPKLELKKLSKLSKKTEFLIGLQVQSIRINYKEQKTGQQNGAKKTSSDPLRLISMPSSVICRTVSAQIMAIGLNWTSVRDSSTR
jgi:hypothetical protein